MNPKKQNTLYRTISVQELRTKMPEISRNLQYGIGYILIRKSKPIAEIRPYHIANLEQESRKKTLSFFSHPPKWAFIKTKKSAVQLVREERD
jgi:hypothetical protein